MRWLLLACLFACGLSGCASDDGNASAAEPTNVVQPIAAGDPSFASSNPLSLVNQNEKLRLGSNRLDILKVFPKPDSATLASNLPAALRGAPGYSSEAWQLGTDGFGWVMFRDQIVLGQQIFERRTEEAFSQILDSVRKANGQETATVAGQNARYYFWESENQRLMVCGFRSPDSSWNVVAVLGAIKVMDALGMSQAAANGDKDAADTTLEEFFRRQGRSGSGR